MDMLAKVKMPALFVTLKSQFKSFLFTVFT